MVVALGGVGQQIDDVIHQHQASQAGNAGAAEHREQAQLLHASVQAVQHLAIGELVALEEPIHQGFVSLGHGLLQGVVELLDDRQLVLGHLNLHPLQAAHLVGALVQHIDDAGDLVAGIPDGHDNRCDLVAVLLTQRFKSGVVVGVILVHLGDVDKSGHIALFAVFPCLLKAHGDAVLGGAHQNGSVGSTEGLHDGAGEVKGTGSVQNVNLDVLVNQRHHGGGDGNMTLDLLGVVIANGVAVGILADPVDGTGHVQ